MTRRSRSERVARTLFKDVLEAAKAGARWVSTSLFRQLAPQVTAFVGGRTDADVDDIVNEIFLGAFRDIDRFGGSEGDFRACVYLSYCSAQDRRLPTQAGPPV